MVDGYKTARDQSKVIGFLIRLALTASWVAFALAVLLYARFLWGTFVQENPLAHEHMVGVALAAWGCVGAEAVVAVLGAAVRRIRLAYLAPLGALLILFGANFLLHSFWLET